MPTNRSSDQSVNDSQHDLSGLPARQENLPAPVDLSGRLPAGGPSESEPVRDAGPTPLPNPVALRSQEIACSAIQAPPVNPSGGES